MLDELKLFLRIADEGTFTAAARRAHLSQPALTAAIHRLEDQLGARLFHRGQGGARLTAAGLALRPWAEAALSAVERGRRAVAEVEGLEAGEVRLAAGSTACSVLLPPVLTAFRAAHPGVRLYLRELNPDEIVRRVEVGEVDLGVVPDRGTEPWLEDALVLVAAPDIDSAHLPHVTFLPGANHRELLDRHFPGVEIAMELTSLAGVKAHVEAGMGVALLSRSSVARDLDEGRLVEVPDPRTPILRTLWLVHAGPLSPAAQALRDALLAG